MLGFPVLRESASQGTSTGYVCWICEAEGKHRAFPTIEALWRNHLFRPLEDWITTKLADAQAVALCRSDSGGTTWTRLVRAGDQAELGGIPGATEMRLPEKCFEWQAGAWKFGVILCPGIWRVSIWWDSHPYNLTITLPLMHVWCRARRRQFLAVGVDHPASGHWQAGNPNRPRAELLGPRCRRPSDRRLVDPPRSSRHRMRIRQVLRSR